MSGAENDPLIKYRPGKDSLSTPGKESCRRHPLMFGSAKRLISDGTLEILFSLDEAIIDLIQAVASSKGIKLSRVLSSAYHRELFRTKRKRLSGLISESEAWHVRKLRDQEKDSESLYDQATESKAIVNPLASGLKNQ